MQYNLHDFALNAMHLVTRHAMAMREPPLVGLAFEHVVSVSAGLRYQQTAIPSPYLDTADETG
jgi:hypothetical protein